jgi:hypothetical protein
MAPHVEGVQPPNQLKYRLSAIAKHVGSHSTKRGHYFAEAFNEEEKCWHLFDDSKVETIRSPVKGSEAYILFYTQIKTGLDSKKSAAGQAGAGVDNTAAAQTEGGAAVLASVGIAANTFFGDGVTASNSKDGTDDTVHPHEYVKGGEADDDSGDSDIAHMSERMDSTNPHADAEVRAYAHAKTLPLPAHRHHFCYRARVRAPRHVLSEENERDVGRAMSTV